MSLLSNGAALRQMLFPPACFICQKLVINDESICQKCSQTIAPLTQPHLCPRCALPLPEGALPGCCGHCLASPPAHQRAVSLFAYHDAVREAILHWKLGGDDRAIVWLLEVASTTIRQTVLPQDLLIPIPMPLQRMRQTGQHHAANLCRLIAEITGCEWEWRWLRRNGNQPRQSSLTRKQRRDNLRCAFQLDAQYQPSHKAERTIWIVDDIMTTGATLHFAARTIARQKTPSAAFTLARTLRND
ncbi:MAG: ComF family protein [Mariprofundales bacterium]